MLTMAAWVMNVGCVVEPDSPLVSSARVPGDLKSIEAAAVHLQTPSSARAVLRTVLGKHPLKR